ncbi:MAG TPA: pyridine nucleotide-disulfide oxidoreductase, partial [Streptosporangiaceae bacterium]
GSVSPAAPAARIPLVTEAPLVWVSPNAIRDPRTPPPRGRFLLRTAEFRPPGRFEIRQDGRLLASARHGRLVPGRAIHLAAAWTARADPAGGPVRVALA